MTSARKQATPRGSGPLPCICGWCGDEFKPGAELDERVNYGICPTCLTKKLGELEKLARRRRRPRNAAA